MGKIYHLPEFDGDRLEVGDLIPAYAGGATRKVTFGQVVEGMRGLWIDRWSAVAADKYTAAPVALHCAGPASFADPTGRPGNSTSVSEGTVIKEGGILYMAVKGGTTGASAPTWPETPGTTVDDGSPTPVTWCAMANHVLALAAENGLSEFISPGTPLRYTSGEDAYYGICIGISDTHLGIAGAPLPASVDSLEFGRPEMVVKMDFYSFAAAYGGLDADLLGNTTAAMPFARWEHGKGYLVHCRFRHSVVQKSTTAKQPRINPQIAGQSVSGWWDGEGVAAPPENTRWSTGGVGLMDAAKYAVSAGDALGLLSAQGEGGGGTTAQYLSASLIFVLE